MKKKTPAPVKKIAAPVKKVAAKAKTVKKAVVKKSAPQKKVIAKKVTAKTSAPNKAASVAHDKATREALKFVDRASALLRKGIKTSSKATHEARTAVHHEAHALLGKASSGLDQALKSGTSLLRNAINKI